MTITSIANNVQSGALIDFNAYNASNAATNVFIGAVAGSYENGPANFVIGRRTGTTSWSESVRVNENGNVQIHGQCTASEQGNCDIAETFLSLDGAGPGDVVSLAPSRFKAMRLADRPYDPMLAGVVSTEPTLLMGQDDVPEGVAIALAGVVPVKVTLENGPIAVGDLLTSSSTPGHAMRAGRPGPVIGKAMEPFDGGQGWTGTIRMLVVPQTCSGTADMAARVEALEATVRVLTERLDRLSRRCGSGEGEAE